MLVEQTLYGTVDKVAEAIHILREYEPDEGYYVAFSGGKDSLCVYWLTKIAGVKADYHYSFTTVDPPELIKFIRTFDDVQIEILEGLKAGDLICTTLPANPADGTQVQAIATGAAAEAAQSVQSQPEAEE